MLDQNTDRMWYVIGAVIIGAAIILILNNTFPQLFASVGETFKGKTEQTTEVVDGIFPLQREVLHQDDLTHGLNTSIYKARPGTYAKIDPTSKGPTGADVIQLEFTEASSGERKGIQDFVVWFDIPYTHSIKEGDTLEISFYAKADQEVDLGLRLGSLFEADLMRTSLNKEWDHYVFRMPVAYYTQYLSEVDKVRGALVFWSYDQSVVRLSNLTIQVYTSEGVK